MGPRRSLPPEPLAAAPQAGGPDPLAAFGPLVGAWFTRRFGGPTPAQRLGWPAIRSGRDTLVLAPTGSGKTLAAFLVSVDEIAQELAAGATGTPPRIHTLYVSPLRALGHDIHRALEEPLEELARLAVERGVPWPTIEVAIRTGDTPPGRRRAIARRPPHILLTTPESLFLMLATPATRPALSRVRRVIVDELHTLAPTKRGAHLALSLEFLEYLAGRPVQRVGLSATQRPLSVMADFLAGRRGGAVQVVDAGSVRPMDLQVVYPGGAPEAGAGGDGWAALVERLWEWVGAHRSTLVFVNNRRQAERLTRALNDAAGSTVAATHHGSLGKTARLAVERSLKAGELKAVVATASLELGIDVGCIDLVAHVGSPGSVAAGLQRIGRSGHSVASASKGRILARHPSDLVEAAAVARAMAAFDIDPSRLPRAPLDVLAQHVVLAGLIRPWSEEELLEVVRRASSFSGISREMLGRVLSLLAIHPGACPRGLRLRPRIEWDRQAGHFQTRREARALLYAGAGTIPDRGTYPVVLAGTDIRLGELDEEFVHETRRGEVFWLGTAAWHLDEIRADRVVVSRAPAGPAKLPFWRGDAPGRSVHVGRLVAELLDEAATRLDDEEGFRRWAEQSCRLDAAASACLHRYLARQRAACGLLPGASRLVVEEFRDEAGDRRIAVHSPWGAPVNRAWAMAMVGWAREQLGLEPDAMACDDGILLRVAAEATVEPIPLVLLEGHAPAELVRRQLAATPLFAQRFREAAARALLLPRAAPRRRVPLWQQRLRAGDLMLAASAQGPDGPLGALLDEAARELVEEDLDPGTLAELVGAAREGHISCHLVPTRVPSPFARSLLFHFTAAFLYEPDAPKAERRAALQMGDLDELLRQAARSGTLGHLLDPDVVQEVSRERRLPPWMPRDGPRSPADLEDWLSHAGDLCVDDLASVGAARAGELQEWLGQLERSGRAVRLAPPASPGEPPRRSLWVHLSAVDLYRRALTGSPGSSGPVDPERAEAAAAVVQRRAGCWGLFSDEDLRARYGLSPALIGAVVALLESQGLLVSGEFEPGAGRRHVAIEVAREMRRRSLARARHMTEPVSGSAFARFLVRHHEIGPDASSRPYGPDAADRAERLARRLAGLYVHPSRLLPLLAAARLGHAGISPLAQGFASGRIGWVARPTAALAAAPPELTLLARDQGPWVAAAARTLLPEGREPVAPTDHERAVASLLASGGSWFAWEVARRLGLDERTAWQALVGLVRRGVVACEDPEAMADWLAAGPAELSRGGTPPPAGRAAFAPFGWGPAAYRRLTDGQRRAIRERAAHGPRPVRFWLVGDGGFGSPTSGATEPPGGPAPSTGPAPAEAWAHLTLERYGLVAPPCLAADGCPLAWAEVAAACRRLEAAGKLVSGYFVQGLGGLQFAPPQTVQALRADERPGADPGAGNPRGAVALALQDPANPWGRLLDPPGWWPSGGSGLVALVDGRPVMVLQAGAGALWHDPEAGPQDLRAGLHALLRLAGAAWPGRRLVLRSLQGEPVSSRAPLASLAVEAGFARGPRTLEHWLASA